MYAIHCFGAFAPDHWRRLDLFLLVHLVCAFSRGRNFWKLLSYLSLVRIGFERCVKKSKTRLKTVLKILSMSTFVWRFLASTWWSACILLLVLIVCWGKVFLLRFRVSLWGTGRIFLLRICMADTLLRSPILHSAVHHCLGYRGIVRRGRWCFFSLCLWSCFCGYNICFWNRSLPHQCSFVEMFVFQM